MKILHVIDSLAIGGAEKLVHDLAIIQKKQGNIVTVLTILKSDTFLVKDLESQNINVISLFKRKRNLYNPFIIVKLIKFFHRYDVIHSHIFPANYWCALCKLFFVKKVHAVTTEHSSNNKRRRHFLIRKIEPIIYKRYDSIVACSEIARSNLSEYLGNPDIICIPNGINVSNGYNTEPYRNVKEAFGIVESDCKIILMVARFKRPKDQHTIIRGLRFLPNNVHAVFVGTGALVEECKDLAVKNDVSGRCHFLSLRNDVPRLLKTSDINVLSSKWEGLSLSTIEGMASGKPFIGTDVDGIRQVVGGAGLLFKYGDEKDFASHVEQLLNSEQFYKQISKQCLDRAYEYDINQTCLSYISLYNKIINNN
jgi:glycosyltransferase involved in cell wall biosynthesis